MNSNFYIPPTLFIPNTSTTFLEVATSCTDLVVKVSKILAAQAVTKTGGFLCVATNDGEPLLLLPIGFMPPEKVGMYSWNAFEKAQRLGKNLSHKSSRESRNEALRRWAGAFRIGKHIFSFSGFPEMWDEATMLLLGFKSGFEDLATMLSLATANSTAGDLSAAVELLLQDHPPIVAV